MFQNQIMIINQTFLIIKTDYQFWFVMQISYILRFNFCNHKVAKKDMEVNKFINWET
jgi:hypothetical protein